MNSEEAMNLATGQEDIDINAPVSETDIETMALTADMLDEAVAGMTVPTYSPTQADKFDPVKLIQNIGQYNPRFANKLWYKYNNSPGQIKTLGDTKYIVSPKGSWIKQN